MNKTVCIYPKDESTDFLSPLYAFLCEKGCEGWHKDTTENTDEAYALIKEADSIIFLGHGASDTLYGSPQDGEFTVLINETNIQELLYGKRCFILACNSYEFCENYNLTSFIGFGNMPTGIVDVKIAMEADTTFPSLEKEDIDTYDAALVSLLIRAFNVAWLTDMEKLYSKIRLYANVEIGECLINKPCKMFREVADLLQDFKNDCTYCP